MPGFLSWVASFAIFTPIFALMPLQSQAAFVTVPDSEVVAEIAPGPSAPLPSKLSLLSWNIQKAQAELRWQKDFQNLSKDRNFVLMQEGVEEPLIVDTLRSLASFGWLMARSFFMETDHKATGVMTGSTENAWSQTFLRSRDREPVVGTPKMALMTTYQMQDGSRLLVVNVHAINFTSFEPFQRQMDDIAGVLKGWSSRVIWAGDFNTWAPNRTDYLRQVARSLGLKEVAFGNDNRKLVLDHIFLRGCSAYGAEVHSDISSSDHFPLTTELLCAD